MKTGEMERKIDPIYGELQEKLRCSRVSAPDSYPHDAFRAVAWGRFLLGTPLFYPPEFASGLVPITRGSFAGIPTMVEPDEGRFLLNFFSQIDPGGDVVEIGSYLGGSTWAIGTGLAASGFSGTYRVFDIFRWSTPANLKVLHADIDVLCSNGLISQEQRKQVMRGDWLGVFEAVHKNQTYGRFLDVRRVALPRPGHNDRFAFEGLRRGSVGALFVDGFKNWNATYEAMKKLIPYLTDGSLVIFQDFSWVACYWLPFLAQCLDKQMTLLFKVTNMAVFRFSTKDALKALERFSPEAVPAKHEEIRKCLANWSTKMFHAGDELGFILHVAQYYYYCMDNKRYQEAAEQFVFIKSLTDRLNMGWLLQSLNRTSFAPQLA